MSRIAGKIPRGRHGDGQIRKRQLDYDAALHYRAAGFRCLFRAAIGMRSQRRWAASIDFLEDYGDTINATLTCFTGAPLR